MRMMTFEELKTIGGIAVAGAALGIFQLLNSGEKVTLARAIGRAGITAGIATSAFSLLVVYPVLPAPAIVGVACLIASLGTTGLERLIDRLPFGTRVPRDQEDSHGNR
jgi:hypothetical protein